MSAVSPKRSIDGEGPGESRLGTRQRFERMAVFGPYTMHLINGLKKYRPGAREDQGKRVNPPYRPR